MSKENKVASASLILIAGTILSKVLGFVRELMVAYRFGAGSISDAFVLTNSIPTLLFVSVATAINVNYIPYYHRIDSETERNRFTSNLSNVCTIVLLAGCLLINLSPSIVLKLFGAGLPEETEEYAIVMLRIVTFSIIPIVWAFLYQAYLQANELFVSTALYGIVTNIVIILFTAISTTQSYYLLSVGTVVSHIVGLLPIIYVVRKKTTFHYSFCLQFRDPLIKGLVLLTVPLMIEDLASSMSLIVDRNLASFLDKGTIAGLSYAGTIGNIASTMIATAIMTATFPLFSKMLANGNYDEFEAQFGKYAGVISYLLAPISLFLIFNAVDIVSFIFEHGAFDKEATKIVSESMICYSVGVLPMGLQSYLIRGFYAMQDTKTPVKIKVFALGCNIFMNLILVQFIQHKGIAISTSISYIIAYFLLSHMLKKKCKITTINRITEEGGNAMLLSLVAGIASVLLLHFVLQIPHVLLRLLVKGLLFIVLYGLLVIVTRKDIVIHMLGVFKKD